MSRDGRSVRCSLLLLYGFPLLLAGEKQRVAFARALLKNSPLLVLDEVSGTLGRLDARGGTKETTSCPVLPDFKTCSWLVRTCCFGSKPFYSFAVLVLNSLFLHVCDTCVTLFFYVCCALAVHRHENNSDLLSYPVTQQIHTTR